MSWYFFNGFRIKIKVKKDGYTTRQNIVYTKSDVENPCLNVFDFGGSKISSEQRCNDIIYSLQDEPEISEIKINGIKAKNTENI